MYAGYTDNIEIYYLQNQIIKAKAHFKENF